MAAVTPVRPVPGAFFNTPAPTMDPLRKDLFGAGVTGNARTGPLGTSPPRPTAISRFPPPATGQSTALPHAAGQALLPPTQPSTDSMSPAQKAAKVINDHLQHDANFPDLDSYCRREYLSVAPAVRAVILTNIFSQLVLRPNMILPSSTQHGRPFTHLLCTHCPTRSWNFSHQAKSTRKWACSPKYT